MTTGEHDIDLESDVKMILTDEHAMDNEVKVILECLWSNERNCIPFVMLQDS